MGKVIFTMFMFFLFSNVANASFYVDCSGVVQINSSDNNNLTVNSKGNKKLRLEVILLTRYFSCKGHARKLDEGEDKRTIDLSIPENAELGLFKKGQLLRVNYNYGDGRTPNGIIKWKRWKFIRFDNAIAKKQIKSLGSQSTQTALAKGLKRYNGNYFSVGYPDDFLVSPSGPIQSFIADVHLEDFEKAQNLDPMETYYYIDTDEVYLTSPDDSVEFFVYSPQWSGRPLTYLKAQDNESIVSHESKKTIKSGVHYGFIQTKRMTFRAKDNSYKRSFVHQRACHSNELKNCITHVFGIKYKDNKS